MSATRAAFVSTALAVATAAVIALKGSGCAESSRAPNASNVAASNQALTAAEVDRVIVRAVSQANAAGVPCAVAVTDREGEVLGVFVMTPRDVNGDAILDAIGEANIQTAIAKAGTASVFQSEQEAFTSRTAFFIVQGHYPPGVQDTAGGPLFGVQDSNIVSSDVRSIAYDQNGDAVGAGITGELGGIPLFKNGAPVGGVGIDSVDVLQVLQGQPTLVSPVQNELDESIAAAAGREHATPAAIRATGIFVDGQRFPFVEAPVLREVADVAATAAAIPLVIGALDGRFPVRTSPLPPEIRDASGFFGIRAARRYAGRLVARSGGPFTNVDRQPGAVFDPAAYRFTGVPAVAATIRTISGIPGEEKFPFIDGVEPPPAEGGLTMADIDQIMTQAVAVASQSSGAIRLPFGVPARVHIVVVDRRGNILGAFRMNDGTLFSFDVAVQKARTCAFFSSNGFAASARGIGFLSRPFFPDGIENTAPGPLARLRDLVNRGKIPVEPRPSLTLIDPPPRPPNDGRFDDDVLRPGLQAFDDFPPAPRPSFADVDTIRTRVSAFGGINVLADRSDVGFFSPGLQSGMQTFAGGVPLYKGGILVGAVGVSGDGIDEDDLTAFTGGNGFQPPPGIRIDEASEDAIRTQLVVKAEELAVAMETHPDLVMRAVYGPIFRRERDLIAARFVDGLNGVRIPYVKLPRRPEER